MSRFIELFGRFEVEYMLPQLEAVQLNTTKKTLKVNIMRLRPSKIYNLEKKC